MQNLSDFLKRFSGFKNPKEEIRLVAEIVSKTLGFNILPDEISIKNGVVTILKTGKIKTEVFMRKSLLLSDIDKGMPNLHIQNIN